MARDPSDSVRKLIQERSEAEGGRLSEWSTKVGKNQTYLQQFIKKGSPKKLPEDVRAKLAPIMGVEEVDLGGPSGGSSPSISAEDREIQGLLHRADSDLKQSILTLLRSAVRPARRR